MNTYSDTLKAPSPSASADSTANDWLGLRDRICVVTGAASGIGECVARSLARVGAQVALLDRDEAGAGRVASEIGRASCRERVYSNV